MRITNENNYDDSWWTIRYRLETACPSLRNKISVIDTADPYYYKEDGINFVIWFENVKH